MSDIRYILSFDCADKTLGICLLGWLPKDHINERVEYVKSMACSDKTSDIAKLISDMLYVKNMWLFNLLPDLTVRDTDDAIRLGRLKSALMIVRKYMTACNIFANNIIVEYQMGQNDLSRLISAAIIYEFCDEDGNIQINICGSSIGGSVTSGMAIKSESKEKNSHIKVIMPAAKNSFYFHSSLSYGNFAAKYKTTKTANKHHTADNFKYFLQLQNIVPDKKIKVDQIKHSDINHISDAFMQAVYWVIEQWSL